MQGNTEFNPRKKRHPVAFNKTHYHSKNISTEGLDKFFLECAVFIETHVTYIEGKMAERLTTVKNSIAVASGYDRYLRVAHVS